MGRRRPLCDPDDRLTALDSFSPAVVDLLVEPDFHVVHFGVRRLDFGMQRLDRPFDRLREHLPHGLGQQVRIVVQLVAVSHFPTLPSNSRLAKLPKRQSGVTGNMRRMNIGRRESAEQVAGDGGPAAPVADLLIPLMGKVAGMFGQLPILEPSGFPVGVQ